MDVMGSHLAGEITPALITVFMPINAKCDRFVSCHLSSQLLLTRIN